MRISELIRPKKPPSPFDAQANAIKQQQKDLKVKKKNLQVQKTRAKANELEQQKTKLLNKP